jgi:hypothetical protein
MDYAAFETLQSRSRAVEERHRLTESLCGRCRNGHVYRRRGKLDVVAHCEAVDRVVPSDITECSRFRDAKSLSLYEMNEIALTIDPRPAVNDGAYA